MWLTCRQVAGVYPAQLPAEGQVAFPPVAAPALPDAMAFARCLFWSNKVPRLLSPCSPSHTTLRR